MAHIIELRDYAPNVRSQEPINSKPADILFFTGVRYERVLPNKEVKKSTQTHNQTRPLKFTDI